MRRLDRTGEKRIAKNGLEMEIIRYGDANNIDVQFEDGFIAKNLKYGHFKIGNIGHPNYPSRKVVIKEKAKEHIGEKNTNNNKLVMEITAYRSNRDIDVRFEDGALVEHRSYGQFIQGNVSHPLYNNKNKRKHIIGEKSKHTSGMEMEIIGYSDTPCFVKVRFADGYETECRISSFVKGEVKNPNITEIEGRAKRRIGMSYISSNGLRYTVSEYNGTHDVTIEWEDGEITKHTHWSQVSVGEVRHPMLDTWRWSNYKGFTCRKAFSDSTGIYYQCKCGKCGKEDILTPQQMMEHHDTHTNIEHK